MKPYVTNAGDKGQVREAEAKERRARQRDLTDLAHVLGSQQGRRLVWRYLGLCGVFQSSFTGNSTTFFNEGRRDIGLRLLADVTDAMPEAYLQMVQESKRAEDEREGRRGEETDLKRGDDDHE